MIEPTLLFRLAIFLFAAANLFVAIILHLKKRHSRALIPLCISALALRILAGSDSYLHSWDERYHALVAKNMIEEPFHPKLYQETLLTYDYKHWTRNHTWLHKPPFSLWLISLSLSIFGISEMAVRIPSILLTTACLPFFYFATKRVRGAQIAFWASVLFSTNGAILALVGGYGPVDHVDSVLLALMTFGYYVSQQSLRSGTLKWTLVIGFLTGLGLLTKTSPALVILGVWGFGLILARWPFWKMVRHAFIALFIAMLMYLSWEVRARILWPEEAAWESYYNFIHLLEPLEGHGRHSLFYLERLERVFTPFIYVAIIMHFAKLVKNRDKFDFLITIWVIVPHLVFSISATKMPAYVALTWPALFIIYSEQILHCHRSISGNTLFKTLLLRLIFLIGIIFPAARTVERLKIMKFNRDTNPIWAQELRFLRQLPRQSPRVVLYNTEHPIEAMFYVDDLIAYKILPDKINVDQNNEAGYDIWVVDAEDLPRWIIHHPDITVLPNNMSQP